MLLTNDISAAPEIHGARIVILQSKWYREHTDKLVSHCVQSCGKLGANTEVHVVSGALELPLAAQSIARSASRPDAIVCLGAVLKGETDHFELVMNECARGLGMVSLAEDIPVINEVLPITSIDQLVARSSDNTTNKGIEAAIAAAETIAWRRSLSGEEVY